MSTLRVPAVEAAGLGGLTSSNEDLDRALFGRVPKSVRAASRRGLAKLLLSIVEENNEGGRTSVVFNECGDMEMLPTDLRLDLGDGTSLTMHSGDIDNGAAPEIVRGLRRDRHGYFTIPTTVRLRVDGKFWWVGTINVYRHHR